MYSALALVHTVRCLSFFLCAALTCTSLLCCSPHGCIPCILHLQFHLMQPLQSDARTHVFCCMLFLLVWATIGIQILLISFRESTFSLVFALHAMASRCSLDILGKHAFRCVAVHTVASVFVFAPRSARTSLPRCVSSAWWR